ncbi:MAG: exopolysaccharide biosynthesis polyprenyl glycosylphosphotransferase, partial [Oscillospiraceae bacterium]|nr:exopolysaccharide biosynthesis polyprenyl glycosylphosphotransferase [Oscillospiraceae bacterium]
LINLASSAFVLLLHTLGFAFAWFFKYNRINPDDPYKIRGSLLVIGLYFLILAFFYLTMGGFKVGFFSNENVIISQIIAVLFVDFLSYVQIIMINRSIHTIKLWPMLLLFLYNAFIIFSWTFLTSKLQKALYPPDKMLFIYGNKMAAQLEHKLRSRSDQYFICSSVRSSEELDYIKDKILNYEAVVISHIPNETRNEILKFCFDKSIDVYVTPKLSDVIMRGAEEIHIFDTPLLLCRNEGFSADQRFFKRIIDIVFSALVIAATSPFMLAAAICIKVYDGGPVFYRQKRYTINYKEFEVIKFRSMIMNAEPGGKPIPATETDGRITPVGKILRKTRLDELPQFFNIIMGDMSVVGPRAERTEHYGLYSETVPEFDFRLKVKAGLTGYAQIMGKYNTTPYDKLMLDMMYIEKFSFWLDIKLIILTIKIMFIRESTEGFEKSPKEQKARRVLKESVMDLNELLPGDEVKIKDYKRDKERVKVLK